MNNIDINTIKSELNRRDSKNFEPVLQQLIAAVETLQQNQNELMEKIQELEYDVKNRQSLNECDCPECRGNYE